jgi:hypothetical protein
MRTPKARTKAASSEPPAGGGHSVPHRVQTLPEQSPSQYRPVPEMTCPANELTDSSKHNSALAVSNLTFFISNSFHAENIARRLIHLADAAYFNRRDDELKQVSEVLGCIGRYDSIAAYYQGIVAQRRHDHRKASELLRYAAASAPVEYQSRALISLDAGNILQGSLTAHHNAKALRIPGVSISTRLRAAFSIIQLYAFNGEHDKAIRQLEGLYPSVRRIAQINPRLYCDLLNSLAVEYSEIDNIGAARQAISVVKRSSLFNSITEYQETEREIQEKESRPVMVAVSVPSETRKVITAMCLLFLSERRHDVKPTPSPRPNPAPSITTRLVTCSPVHGPPFWK